MRQRNHDFLMKNNKICKYEINFSLSHLVNIRPSEQLNFGFQYVLNSKPHQLQTTVNCIQLCPCSKTSIFINCWFSNHKNFIRHLVSPTFSVKKREVDIDRCVRFFLLQLDTLCPYLTLKYTVTFQFFTVQYV